MEPDRKCNHYPILLDIRNWYCVRGCLNCGVFGTSQRIETQLMGLRGTFVVKIIPFSRLLVTELIQTLDNGQ